MTCEFTSSWGETRQTHHWRRQSRNRSWTFQDVFSASPFHRSSVQMPVSLCQSRRIPERTLGRTTTFIWQSNYMTNQYKGRKKRKSKCHIICTEEQWTCKRCDNDNTRWACIKDAVIVITWLKVSPWNPWAPISGRRFIAALILCFREEYKSG